MGVGIRKKDFVFVYFLFRTHEEGILPYGLSGLLSVAPRQPGPLVLETSIYKTFREGSNRGDQSWDGSLTCSTRVPSIDRSQVTKQLSVN